MESQKYYLGIDIGSVSICYVLINEQKKIIKSNYLFHQGNIYDSLRKQLERIDFSNVRQVAYNHKSADFFTTGISVNEQIALIEGTRYDIQNIGSLFIIGGETFGLILFDEKGQYQKYISNSSCAAGTGAFLDQQAKRLGLSGSEHLSKLSDSFTGKPPKIATRCAVFAKTDLIHCQQQGYTIEAISAGLCKGLAHNIADTLVKGITLREPVIAVGGVSKNKSVIRYLSEIIGLSIIVPENSLLSGAIGCALIAQNKHLPEESVLPFSLDTLLKTQTQNKYYFYPPLSSTLSTIPDFHNHTHYNSKDVEVDLYNKDLFLQDSSTKDDIKLIPVYLGIDIGSTSTKAIVVSALDSNGDENSDILVGLYTRTMGQPIKATQSLLRALREIEEKYKIKFEFCGVGTTGSGRKFIQKLINADSAIDEITAHAKAAHSLNPNIDTIIEIGGQDAKFTTLKNGQVTFSVMNYVCAAGTGSFIEEQAQRLNVPLSEYSKLALGVPSPLTSDRCTVFMERDLNHLLSQGYSKRELLTAVLHSVRDNYLSKVANISKIGNVICFQGATAKNSALVYAFEQKLQKPIFVSKYCHLTGALGICLILKEQNSLSNSQTENKIIKSKFRGIDFYKESPVVINGICNKCENNCKIVKIKLTNETISWGYLCGRDESKTSRKSIKKSNFDLLDTRRHIFNPTAKIDSKNISDSNIQKSIIDEIKQIDIDDSLGKLKQKFEINLLNLRHKLFLITQDDVQSEKEANKIKIGIPDALYMQELIPFWRMFFMKLGYSVITVEDSDANIHKEFLKDGKEIAGAEFCAPISIWHGQIKHLDTLSDYIFLPQMFEHTEKDTVKLYCYYSSYSVAIIQNNENLNIKNKSITPIIDLLKPAIYNVQQIYQSLPDNLKFIQTPGEIQSAYIEAWNWFTEQKNKLVEIFEEQKNISNDISVVLLGRPYLVMSQEMSKNIHQKFNEMNVKVFFQDMLPSFNIDDKSPAKKFIEWNYWRYGENILKSADYIGKTKGLYPIYLTAFKCSPDSFVLNYFKEIMDTYQKPYLILQLDEHGSSVGYETRIESAIRSFNNHFTQDKADIKPNFELNICKEVSKNETILVPNYDSISCNLICASFKHAGYNTYLIEETPTTVLSSIRLNDGQCLPVSSIVQGAIETVQKYNLNPETTVIFLNSITRTACNFPQYPVMAKKLLEQQGGNFEKLRIFATEFDMRRLPLEVIYDVYCSYLLGGFLRKIGCKIRPYEITEGQTNNLMDKAIKDLYECIATGGSKEETFKKIVDEFLKIPVNKPSQARPKVAIIGDLYVRDNDVFNQQLIYEIEKYGGEVITTPFNYILRMLFVRQEHILIDEKQFLSLLRNKLILDVLEKFERRFFNIANEILCEDFPVFNDSILEYLKKYDLSLKHGGETSQNILKIFSLLKHYPGIALFVHVNPIFCCPGLVSESIFKAVEKDIGIPIVSIIYDGTATKRNEILAPYLHYMSSQK